MNRVTVFTPTYNRAKTLERLYKSLINQKNKNFEWLIIDDGSIDDTKVMVNKFINEDRIKIKYYYKENEGKHIAFNCAIEHCKTEFLVCVDSDDFLEDDNISTIYSKLDLLNSENIGLIFPRKNYINKIEDLKKFDENEIDVMDLKFLTSKNVETTIVLKTQFIKDIKFPKIEKEKFASEEILYNYFSKYGKFIYVNCFVVCSEYLADGLTKNIYKNYKYNFYYSILLQKSRYEFVEKYNIKIMLKNKIKCIININALCIANKKNIYKHTPSVLLSFILYPISYVWSCFKYEK